MNFGRRARLSSLGAFVLGALLGALVLWPRLSGEAQGPKQGAPLAQQIAPLARQGAPLPDRRGTAQPAQAAAAEAEPAASLPLPLGLPARGAEPQGEPAGQGADRLALFGAPRAQDLPEPAPGHTDKVIPHPLDEARQRLTEQRRVFTQVKHAIRTEDFAEARALLEAHDRETQPEEAWSDQREGYQLIVDCKQFPGEETRARGQRFVDEQRGSTLRRSVRRACELTGSRK